MKRLLQSFALLLAVPLVFVGVAQASNHFWKIEMSDPTTSNQLRTFNVEYTALSTDSGDTITVNLVRGGSNVQQTQTTPGGGGSGAFAVTVNADGSYVYRLDATSSVDGETRSTASREITVETPEGSDESIITTQPVATGVNAGDATGAPDATAGDATGTQGGANAGGDTGADGAGQIAGESVDGDGEITADAAVTQNTEGEILGVADNGANNSNFWNIIIALALLGIAGYYWFFYRVGRVNPFAPVDEE